MEWQDRGANGRIDGTSCAEVRSAVFVEFMILRHSLRRCAWLCYYIDAGFA